MAEFCKVSRKKAGRKKKNITTRQDKQINNRQKKQMKSQSANGAWAEQYSEECTCKYCKFSHHKRSIINR